MSSSKGKVVIVKKVINGGGGGHGGSWKVAMADLALAMMALFMVLWLLSVTDEEQLENITAYFKDPGAFRHSGSPHPIKLTGSPSTVKEISSKGPSMQGRAGPDVIGDSQPTPKGEKLSFDDIMGDLRMLLGSEKTQYQQDDPVYMEVLPEGLRLVILDFDDKHMFRRGSSRLTPYYEDLLLMMAQVLGKTENKILVSGHTDAASFSENHFHSNWKLSGARAQVAQRTLAYGGIPDERFMMVSAMSDHRPIHPGNPESGANRRIELLLLNPETEKKLGRLFSPIDKDGEEKESPISEEAMEQVKDGIDANSLPPELQPPPVTEETAEE
ncbi:flagellar motor protein MotB [Kistimonas scapharcae]|uniref:Flagellar motor protein MotB n=1 Tax=Kistimonas scapharcae TaxID=1036133 RepID=A0ABP8V101_9GAMM